MVAESYAGYGAFVETKHARDLAKTTFSPRSSKDVTHPQVGFVSNFPIADGQFRLTVWLPVPNRSQNSLERQFEASIVIVVYVYLMHKKSYIAGLYGSLIFHRMASGAEQDELRSHYWISLLCFDVADAAGGKASVVASLQRCETR